MRNFLENFLEADGVAPSAACLQSFNNNFNDAINVDWYSKEGYYEAVFYRNSLEHIALFNLDGNLLEYMQTLPLEDLPEPIKNIALSIGEIMNLVLRNKGNLLEYEIIIRDKSFKRHMIVLSGEGDIKEEEVL